MQTLELHPVIESVNWTLFDNSQVAILKKAINNGHHDELAALLYEVNPEQANEISKVQKQLRPREFKFESQAQKDCEIWMNTNFNDITPEKMEEWQVKIDAEKEEMLNRMNGGVVDAVTSNTGENNTFSGTITNVLSEVKGLGETSIKKLNAANIYSIDELRKLSQDERKRILGPLVAAKITQLT